MKPHAMLLPLALFLLGAGSFLTATPTPITGMSKVTRNRWTAQTLTQSSPDNPKDHYKRGEQYLKWKRVFDAYEEFAQAATLDSGNEKYRKKMIEVGKTASRLAESEAREVMNISLRRAEWLLRRAIEYDDSNISAGQLLTLIRQNIANASEKAKQAQAALDSGEVGLAENIINSLTEYRESVPAISGLEQELLSAKRAVAALSLWERKEGDRAIEELSRAEEARNSVFTSKVSSKIRQEFSEYLLSTATTIKAQTLANILEKLQMVKKALVIYSGNVKALDLERQTSSALVEAVLSQNPGSSGETVSSNKARVYLETLRSTAPWITGDSKFDREKARIESISFPALRARITSDEFQGCSPNVNNDSIARTVREALVDIVSVDGKMWDVTINIKGLTCSSTEIPKQLAEKVNSTYVAGHNQLANPEYINLQNKINDKRIELAKAEAEDEKNPSPNFASGVAAGIRLGLIRNDLKKLQNDLANMPPYITREILQQYQYEKFESYRSHQIEAKLQVFSRDPRQQYSSEITITVKSEGRGEGISGVLDQDRSGARNKEPEMPAPTHYVDHAWVDFKARLSGHSRDLIGGYFASAVLNQKLADSDRMAALLYLLGIAGGTRYEAESQKLKLQASQAILTSADAVKSFVHSLSLPIPDQVAIANAGAPDSTSPKTSFEGVLDGVVTVETDAAKGSGFFLTPACLIITNEHVINGAETIIFRTSTRKLFVAEVLAVDADRDLALLRSNARSCSHLSLEDTTKVSVGQDVYAVGNPLEFSGTVTKGIISAIRTTGSGIRLIQVDAAINPGNSGGPLVSSGGKVLGVNTFKRRGSEGLNFAVASDEIKNAFGRFLR